MKYLLMLLLALPVVGQDIKGCKTTYDKFRDVSTARCNLKLKHVAKVRLSVIETVLVREGDTFWLQFVRVGDEWWFLHRRDLIVLADGERLPLGEGKHDGQTGRGGVTEALTFSLSKDALTKMAASKSVELQLAGSEQKFDDKTLTLLRAIL